jgi:hypothetical protein
MPLFIYPHTAADLSIGGECCKDLCLPMPIVWGEELLDHLIEDLLDQQITITAASWNTLDAPVILLAGINREQLMQILRWYKAKGEWPIFATLTKQSLRMPLRELLKHLVQDREREAAARQRKKN